MGSEGHRKGALWGASGEGFRGSPRRIFNFFAFFFGQALESRLIIQGVETDKGKLPSETL